MLDIHFLLEQAVAFHQSDDLNEAEKFYNKALEVAPDHFDVLNLLGTLECQRGRFDAAALRLTRATEIKAGNAATRSILGYALRKLGRHQEAVETVGRALALAPDFVDALPNRSASLGDLRRRDEARADHDRAIKLAPILR